MTKYVLNSGNIRGDIEKAKKFTAEVVSGRGEKPKILLCFFANLREDWELKYEKYTKDIVSYLPEGIQASFELAMPDEFVEQCKRNDIVWIHGGDDHLVMYWLKQFDLKKIWDGKILAVSSASTDAVVSSFWTGDWRNCMEGLGLVPVKFIPHYGSKYGVDDPRGPIDWETAKKELANYGDKNLPIYTLTEGEFVVVEV